MRSLWAALLIFGSICDETAATFEIDNRNSPLIPTADLVDLKALLHVAFPKLVKLSTLASEDDLDSYIDIAAPIPYLERYALPPDDDELNELLTNITENLDSRFAKKFWNNPLRKGPKSAIYSKCDSQRLRVDEWKFYFEFRTDAIFYWSSGLRDFFARPLRDPEEVFNYNKCSHDPLLFEPELVFKEDLILECIANQNFTFFPFENLWNDMMRSTAVMAIALRADIAIEGYESMSTLQEIEDTVTHVKTVARKLRELHYNNSFNAFVAKMREITPAAHDGSLSELANPLFALREAYYESTDPFDFVLLTSRNCPIVSYHVGFANDTSRTQIFQKGDIHVLIHHTPESESTGMARRLFESKKSTFEDVLHVRTEGVVFVSVSADAAKENVDRLMEMHEFSFVAVFIIEDSGEQEDCVVGSMPIVSVYREVEVGSPLTRQEKRHRVIAVFGF